MNAKLKVNLSKPRTMISFWTKINLGEGRTAFISKELIKIESLSSKGI